jgi:hypothetical protein
MTSQLVSGTQASEGQIGSRSFDRCCTRVSYPRYLVPVGASSKLANNLLQAHFATHSGWTVGECASLLRPYRNSDLYARASSAPSGVSISKDPKSEMEGAGGHRSSPSVSMPSLECKDA